MTGPPDAVPRSLPSAVYADAPPTTICARPARAEYNPARGPVDGDPRGAGLQGEGQRVGVPVDGVHVVGIGPAGERLHVGDGRDRRRPVRRGEEDELVVERDAVRV